MVLVTTRVKCLCCCTCGGAFSARDGSGDDVVGNNDGVAVLRGGVLLWHW